MIHIKSWRNVIRGVFIVFTNFKNKIMYSLQNLSLIILIKHILINVCVIITI